MNTTLVKWILVSVSVVLIASLIGTISWTYSIASNILSDYNDNVIKVYSEAGLSMLIDAKNLKDIDSANLYKILELNSNIIVDYYIQNKDSTYVTDLRDLLNRPIDRFSIKILGDSGIGYSIEIKQVS